MISIHFFSSDFVERNWLKIRGIGVLYKFFLYQRRENLLQSLEKGRTFAVQSEEKTTNEGRKPLTIKVNNKQTT